MGPLVASSIEWAYLAGIIDGEGCVTVNESKPNRKNFSPRFRLVLKITNTSEHLISWVHERFAGYIYLSHAIGQHKATKNCWTVSWMGGNAEEILKGCFPYLIVKKYQAELAFKLREMVGSYSPKGKSFSYKGKPLSEEVINERRAVLVALKVAKRTQ